MKRKKKNLELGWTDFRKAYDMAPQSLVRESLNKMSIANNVVTFLGKTMKS